MNEYEEEDDGMSPEVLEDMSNEIEDAINTVYAKYQMECVRELLHGHSPALLRTLHITQ